MPAVAWLLGGLGLGAAGAYVVSDSVKTGIKWAAIGAGIYLVAKKVKK